MTATPTDLFGLNMRDVTFAGTKKIMYPTTGPIRSARNPQSQGAKLTKHCQAVVELISGYIQVCLQTHYRCISDGVAVLRRNYVLVRKTCFFIVWRRTRYVTHQTTEHTGRMMQSAFIRSLRSNFVCSADNSGPTMSSAAGAFSSRVVEDSVISTSAFSISSAVFGVLVASGEEVP